MSSDKVIKFYPKNSADNPDNVLEQAIGDYDNVLIIGYEKDGHMTARADTSMTAAEMNFLIDVFKTKLLNGDYYDEEL